MFTPPRGVLKFPGGVFALLSKHPLGGVFKNLGVIRDQNKYLLGGSLVIKENILRKFLRAFGALKTIIPILFCLQGPIFSVNHRLNTVTSGIIDDLYYNLKFENIYHLIPT